MSEPDHIHNYWRYFIVDDPLGAYRVYEDPFLPVPEHSAWGYECYCGLTWDDTKQPLPQNAS